MDPTPRVNSALLANFSGKTVRITGKVISLAEDSAVIEASDAGQVTIRLGPEASYADQYVEIIGKVVGDLTVQELSSVNLGDNIDMDLVEQTVQLMQGHPQLFGMDA
ncbi:hypothetical protein RQP46_006399 [Phenoliferia psychrophenolica]